MTTTARGRPRQSSRDVLEEAAQELFLEQGYDNTTVDQIAQRAGVSRATFFNYFSSKAEVLWCQVDDELEHLRADIDSGLSLARALEVSSERWEGQIPPFIASQASTISAEREVTAEAGKRIVALAGIIGQAGVDSARAWLVAGAIVQAVVAWVYAGHQRAALSSYLQRYATEAPELVS